MTPKRIALLQSNYIPWKGYFDLIRNVDEFILYDDVQYTKNDWRNRNRIKTPLGTEWLTIEVAKDFGQTIREAKIANRHWGERHWKTICHNYQRAAYFERFASRFERIYTEPPSNLLSEVNRVFIELVCEFLGISTRIRSSAEFKLLGDKNERIVNICRETGATDYLSGPSARGYLNDEVFRAAGVEVQYFDYAGYPEYPQLFGAFVHEVSIIDLLINMGTGAIDGLKRTAEPSKIAAIVR